MFKRRYKALVVALAFLAANGCGRKDKGDSGDEPAPPAAAADPAALPETAHGSGSDADALANVVKSDGDVLGLRSGDEYIASLLAGAGLKLEDLPADARTEIIRLAPTLPKAGGGIPTFTAGHLTNGVKIAYRICDAWMKKAAAGTDDRFPPTMPWKDGGPIDKILALSALNPVFEVAFWGPDPTTHPSTGDVQTIMGPFNEALAVDLEDENGNAESVNFISSATANCVVYALASPSWFK